MANHAEASIIALGLAASAGCIVGRFVGLSEGGLPLVDYEGNPTANGAACVARTICLDFARPGGVASDAAVLLQFERGDPNCPVVIGVLQPPVPASCVRVDDETACTTLRANRRLELVCGKASIVLSADGKVVVKGAHLVSRSSGPNKIRGATVDIN